MTFILSRLEPTFAAKSIFKNKIVILNFLKHTLINGYNITDYKKSYFLFCILHYWKNNYYGQNHTFSVLFLINLWNIYNKIVLIV